jgi:hypothetical protein
LQGLSQGCCDLLEVAGSTSRVLLQGLRQGCCRDYFKAVVADYPRPCCELLEVCRDYIKAVVAGTTSRLLHGLPQGCCCRGYLIAVASCLRLQGLLQGCAVGAPRLLLQGLIQGRCELLESAGASLCQAIADRQARRRRHRHRINYFHLKFSSAACRPCDCQSKRLPA